MSEWKETTFGEIVTFQRGHDLTQVDFSEGEYIVAGSNGPIGYHNVFTTKGPGLTIGRSGNSIGVAHYYENDFWAHNTTLYSKEFHNSHPKYVYYLLKTFNFSFLDGGSAVPTLNRNHVHTIEIKVPEFNEQQSIAAILSSLDNKIDLLRRQNQTLEQLAQTIFKQWFVHYQYPGATGQMETTELGDVPKGWRMGTIGDIYKTTSGGTPSRAIPEYYMNGTVEWIKSKELDGHYVLNTEEKITETAVKESSAKLIPENSVLVAMYGNTVGELGLVGKEATCNQAICGIIEKKNYSFSYAYLWLKQNLQKLKNLAIGSAQQNLSQIVISNFEMLIPDINTAKLFSLAANPLFEKIKTNQKEIQTLTQLRDSLLPRLMSGRLRVG